MALPIVFLAGTPFEQGFTHGRTLTSRVRHNLALYFHRFEREVLLSRAEVFSVAERYAEVIARQNPDYVDGMRGVAAGAGVPLPEIVALNLRYEILYYRFGALAVAGAGAAEREPTPDGCTAFALLPEATASGHLLMGQNWDWIPDVQGAVLRATDADGFETLAFTEAGIVGAKIGLNAAGVGLAINGMTTTGDDWNRLTKPFHVRCYEILRSRTLDAAMAVVTDEARPCSTNFLLAQAPNRVADLEAAPGAVNVLTCRDGCLTHANHFVAPGAMGVVETPSERMGFSRAREARLRALLLAARPASVEGVQAALRDTENEPFGICRHRDWSEPESEHYTTVTSVVMDLETRTMHLTDGAPDEAAYQTVSLGGAG